MSAAERGIPLVMVSPLGPRGKSYHVVRTDARGRGTRPLTLGMLRGHSIVIMLAALACSDPSGPSTHEHGNRLLIAGTEDGAIVVDLDWRGIIRRSGPQFL